MSISEKEVRHIANLSRLGIKDSEVSFYAKEMSAILDYMEILQSVEVLDEKELEEFENRKRQSVRQDTASLFSARSFSGVLVAMTKKAKNGFVQIKQVLQKNNAE